MTESEKFQKIYDRVEECIAMYEDHFGDEIPMPYVRCELTGRNAGVCIFKLSSKECTLDFNKYLVENDLDNLIAEIVPHEVAHYCTDYRYGIIKNGSKTVHHGTAWKNMMRVFGAKPIPYHTLNVKAGRNLREFEYTCECGRQHTVTTIIHNKIQKKGQKYICRHCKGVLTFVKEIKK
jgi:predicted SprT family Zn-dependent metalloprotease